MDRETHVPTPALDGIKHFYDSLADAYHLIFADWDAAIVLQAGVLDALIRNKLRQESIRLHDCACGIGTQAIGLAAALAVLCQLSSAGPAEKSV
jgi:hypothetical protein